MLKELTPPIIVRSLSRLFYGWSGNYSSWEHAKNKCGGYEDAKIFDKVKSALLKVKNGEAVFERDSVLFDKIHYSYPLLAALNHVALHDKEKLNVLDFGGSLGSSYFQNKHFYSNLKDFSWSVVEQKHFVEEGQKTFSDKHLQFYFDIDSCLKEKSINLFLLASVLQYLEKPYGFLQEVANKNVPYIMIDRTPVYLNKDRITVQKVPKQIYEAQYPCWILNEEKMLNILSNKYELIFDSTAKESVNLAGAHLKAYFLKRKK